MSGAATASASPLMDVLTKATVRELVLSENIRIDGRDTTTIRPISVEVGILPRTHGSGLFTRGQTQALSIATLGPSSDVQRLDTISPETEKRYLHHYNFPPYSVGESRPMRGPGRREIGHGALAERRSCRSCRRWTSSRTSSASSARCLVQRLDLHGQHLRQHLALMDAGVPIKAPVAGAAMGLITDPDTNRYAVLTDITGKEDAYGDMDFKVAGTAEGVTALQMDIKVAGITPEILRDALEQARTARLFILGKMTEVISASRSELSPYAPRITTIKIPVDKIRDVIGAGGKVIRQITAETGTQINVEDDGTIQIAAVDGEAAEKAVRWIEGLTRDVEVGKEYLGKVTRIMNFGAFVEILPGKEGLVHISQLADYRVARVEDVVSIGDELMVVVTEIDRMGRVNLSRRAAMERHMATPEPGPVPGWCRGGARLGGHPDERGGRSRRRRGRGAGLHALFPGRRPNAGRPRGGNAISDVLLVGEGPGQREDATGRPFVGAAGQLLEEMLGSIGWQRHDVFITNVVKCRPPGNRDPEPTEISACRAVPRPPGTGARPRPDRDPRPPFAPALPARGAHLGGPRPAPPRGRPVCAADVPSRCRAPGHGPARDAGRTSGPAGRAAGGPWGLSAEQADPGPSESDRGTGRADGAGRARCRRRTTTINR